MAVLFIAEYADSGFITGPVAVGKEPAHTNQTVAIGAGSVQSNAFKSNTLLVRLHSDVICSIAFGDNPTASATSARMAANQTEYFQVKPGQKVAVIQNT
jgi:hypothetical protein